MCSCVMEKPEETTTREMEDKKSLIFLCVSLATRA